MRSERSTPSLQLQNALSVWRGQRQTRYLLRREMSPAPKRQSKEHCTHYYPAQLGRKIFNRLAIKIFTSILIKRGMRVVPSGSAMQRPDSAVDINQSKLRTKGNTVPHSTTQVVQDRSCTDHILKYISNCTLCIVPVNKLLDDLPLLRVIISPN